MNLKPGVSATLGVSQGSHTPYAHVTGRMFGLVTSKRLDLDNPLSLLALAGILGYAAKKGADKKAKSAKKVAKPKDSSSKGLNLLENISKLATPSESSNKLFGGKF